MTKTAPSERLSCGDDVDGESLHILVVTVAAAGIGGMQRHTHDLVRGLVEAGHEVEVLCPRGPELESDLHGARWSLLDTIGRADPAWPYKVVAAYSAIQRRAPLDVIHSESTSAAPLARRGVRTAMVVMYHGNYLGLVRAHVKRATASPRTAAREGVDLGSLTWRYLRDRNAWAFRNCDAIVVSQQQLRDSARSSLTSRHRFHVVPNGVDTSLFRPGNPLSARRALGLTTEGLVLATIGRLNRLKGFDVALQTLARVKRDYPDTRLLVVGDGEERAARERLARKLDVANEAFFVGRQSQEKIAEYLVASDVFLFPTRANEAGPLVVPQALASGVPVIASRVGGVSEVLEGHPERRVGLLVRPGDLSDLEGAVRLLIQSPELRRDLGIAARELAVDEYSLETMVARTVDVYRRAIARTVHARSATARSATP
jgi:glycosyltransferase involved in cell wall biosynthesis